MVNKG